jgi:hypothetical protein
MDAAADGAFPSAIGLLGKLAFTHGQIPSAVTVAASLA